VVIDDWLGLSPRSANIHLPILVARNDDLLVGIQVDAILGVVTIAESDVKPHPQAGASSLLSGICHQEGQPSITVISETALLGILSQQASFNL
jgi:chemotaxis signal transduction protein